MNSFPNNINRVIFDTNIYGFIIEEDNTARIEQRLCHNKNLVVYGCSLIRKELRKKALTKARLLLLRLYDHITKERTLQVTPESEELAKAYYQEAKRLGKEKVQRWEEYQEDFMIIAVATLNNLDIIFSADEKTMFGTYSQEAYKIINFKHNLRSPTLFTYNILKKSFVDNQKL